MGKLDGKVALVTGAARGQGAAEVRRFVEEGAHVVAADVLHDEGKALVDELGERAEYVGLDVTSEEDWTAAVAGIEERHGHLDVVVNNAGILRFSPLVTMPLEDYMAVVQVNQVGVFLGIKTTAPLMIRSGGGSIINISSVDGLVGMPGFSAYAATKHAVVGMTKSAAIELAGAAIRVNSVHPGGVDTPMFKTPGLEFIDVGAVLSAKVPMGRLGTSEEVASLVCYLASDESRYCTGSSFVIDGGMIAGVMVG